MTLRLNDGTIPSGLGVKTSGPPMANPFHVFLGVEVISMKQLLDEAWVLLIPQTYPEGDPYLMFVRAVQKLEQKPGWSAQMAQSLGSTFGGEIIDKHLKRFALPDSEAEAARFPSMAQLAWGGSQHAPFRHYQISRCDFVELLWYVLTNTDLRVRGDPRRTFVKRMKRVHIEDLGHNFRLTETACTN